MEVVILASGSKGNVTLIKTDNCNIIVDMGISYSSFKNKINKLNYKTSNFCSILISHEHSDHIRGLKTFLKNHPNINIFITEGTYSKLDDDIKNNGYNFNIIKQDDLFNIDTINVETFELSHDAVEPVGFIINYNNKKIVFATDTGYIDQTYFDKLKDADLYILEANHEPSLLMDSKRPYYLKQRILGDTGHLSNNEAAYLMDVFIKDKDEVIWAVSHISEDCNTNYFIERSIVEYVSDPTKLKLVYTSQETSEVIKL